ncbi:MAG: hypothetical protein R2713_20810 [Ilumatobacteraceae bacterium]
MRVQRFATLDDIAASHPTIEEREEYELPVSEGMVMFAGVDYEAILRAAAAEADVIVWDGGNNDLPFVRPDVMVTVLDALRPGHERGWHPGEVNLRLADVVVVNKIDAAAPSDIGVLLDNVRRLAPTAVVVQAASPVVLADGPSIAGGRVLVVEDGPTITHGGMPFGAGTVAACAAGAAELVDPRPYAEGRSPTPSSGTAHRPGAAGDGLRGGPAVRSRSHDRRGALRCGGDRYADRPHRVIALDRPVRHASYSLREVSRPDLAEVLAPHVRAWRP